MGATGIWKAEAGAAAKNPMMHRTAPLQPKVSVEVEKSCSMCSPVVVLMGLKPPPGSGCSLWGFVDIQTIFHFVLKLLD